MCSKSSRSSRSSSSSSSNKNMCGTAALCSHADSWVGSLDAGLSDRIRFVVTVVNRAGSTALCAFGRLPTSACFRVTKCQSFPLESFGQREAEASLLRRALSDSTRLSAGSSTATKSDTPTLTPRANAPKTTAL